MRACKRLGMESILFVLFVTDLPLHVSVSDTNLYADDTNISARGKSVCKISGKLSHDMTCMYKRCAENDLEVMNEKTKCMHLTTSQRQRHMKQELFVKVNEMMINSCST